MLKNTFLMILLMVTMVGFAQPPLFSQYEPAFDGNDLVAYYKDQKAVKGNESFKTTHGDWKLLFSSKENLEEFKRNTQKYLPPHQGYCAIALVKGDLIKPDYSNFKIQDDQLLFFLTKAFFNGKTHWEKDPDKNKAIADLNFNKIVDRGAQR